MEDLSAFLKKGFQRLHEKALTKEYKQKTIDNRRESCANLRRMTRDTLKWQNRNIDINNLTPINTPKPENNKKKPEAESSTKPLLKTGPSSKRLDLLKRWKQEKAQKKLEEKKNQKPLFKVAHVPVSVGLPNLENVNREIKGKPIKIKTPLRSKFAPENHKFRPPVNIKPVPQKNIPNVRSPAKMNRTNLNINKDIARPRNTWQEKGQEKQVPLRREISRRTTAATNIRAEVRTTSVKKVYNPSSSSSDTSASTVNSNKEKTPKKAKPASNKKTQNNKKSKKAVIWDVVEIIESDDEILTQEISAKSPKKTYNKTPIKKRVKQDSDDDEEFLINDRRKKKVPTTPQNKTPVKNSTVRTPRQSSNRKETRNGGNSIDKILQNEKVKKDSKKSDIIADKKTSKVNKRQSRIHTPIGGSSSTEDDERMSKQHNKEPYKGGKSTDGNTAAVEDEEKKASKVNKRQSRIHTPIQRSAGTSNDGGVSKHNSEPVKRAPSTDDSDEDFIASRKFRPSTSYEESPQRKTLEDSLQNIPKHDIKDQTNFKEDDNVFYEDDEIVLKTPLKKLPTPKPTRKSILRSVEKSASKRFSTSTPLRTNQNKQAEVYVSPFVTISRGKESARKEFQLRLLNGGSMPNSTSTSPASGAAFFARKLDDEVDRIQGLCSEWTELKLQIPEEVQDMVDAALGQSNLLITKKFQQFRKLIRLCEEGVSGSQKPVTCTDLHGYWDTMYMQVEDIEKRFNNLQRLKANNWTEVLIPEKKPVAKRPKPRPKKVQAQSRIKEMIKNSRMRKNNPHIEVGSGEPAEAPSSIAPRLSLKNRQSSGKKRQSLRISIIGKEAARRLSSPGLTMMKITQAIKSGNGVTPNKSILKTDNNRSERKITKSVLFKDLEEDKENSFDDLMKFSPMATRSSRRNSNKIS